MKHRQPLPGHELRKRAGQMSVHPTTLAKALRGERIAPLPFSRIVATLKREGLMHLLPGTEQTTKTSADDDRADEASDR